MRLITRSDASLVVGLIAGTTVIFQRPLALVWETAWDVQRRYQVDLLPALTIFVGVFMFHEASKRQHAKAQALAAVAEAAAARARSAELERFMTFSQALANVLESGALQRTLWRHLPSFAAESEFWVLVRRPDHWEMMLPDTTGSRQYPLTDFEAMADRTVSPGALPEACVAGMVHGDVLCFPMVAGETVGVLGIHNASAITSDQRKALGVAAGLIAGAVRNVQLFLETREYSVRDSLTGCFNHAHGLETLDRELSRARRSRQPLSILMFDIDHFKMINDELGHLRGDDLLRAVGAQLTLVLRRTDVKCRYGGDEFLIILPDTPLAGALQAAEAVRLKVSALAIVAGSKTIPVGVSIGVAALAPDDLSISALLDRADRALYQAKRAGRDRSIIADAPGSPAVASGSQVPGASATGPVTH